MKLYEMPRCQIDDPDGPAPAPSHNKTNEALLAAQRAQLKPLDKVAARDNRQDPVLWACPATYHDYSRQNCDGIMQGANRAHSNPGPHRIITDRNKNIQGMVTHPAGNKNKFVRAPEQVHRVHRQKLR
ncbi:hypothetical protein BO78DRAFT_412458 [Aspergillus sclerotiicarbonarius CBS 121057]|uniref:Uncharacterized protein n=1 Tax=Aspergillus sclerotiicarbonarius (strain CBS 121057 / IBT 28362) TaxID=1448318 RepID=A0A319E963_ASPSB|nr:hypothetical protein BO78DRAFT_412458 [Aspergillus sclerotiicarbonarius CBS 121057]